MKVDEAFEHPWIKVSFSREEITSHFFTISSLPKINFFYFFLRLQHKKTQTQTVFQQKDLENIMPTRRYTL
jgi:hypothetical protein